MYILECTDIYEVVDISTIVHRVHLIPYFETPTSARDALREKRDVYSFKKYFLNHFSGRYTYLNFQ